MKEGNPTRAVGYIRVSMREQVDGHSLAAQERLIREYADSNGWTVIDIYIDAGISAKKDSKRPALDRLMKDAEQGNFDVVVVHKVDRFFRHLAGLLRALDHLKRYRVSFVSVQEKLDFTTPWGKLMLAVLGTLAEIYIDNLRQETKKGKQQRARKGLWNGSIPFGYCNGLCAQCTDPNGEGYCPSFGKNSQSDGKRLIAHPIESQAVKLAFKWYAEGNMSDARIARQLNETLAIVNGCKIPFRTKGGPGRTQPGPLSKDAIRSILKRFFYTGNIAYYGTNQVGIKQRRADYKETYQGTHPALIELSLFEKVQDIRKHQSTVPPQQCGRRLRIYPLTGLLRCGSCGSPMRGSSSKNIRYYRDSANIEKQHICSQPTLRADDIEEQVRLTLCQVLDAYKPKELLESIQLEIQRIKLRYERAKELYLAGEIDRTRYNLAKTKHDKELSGLQFFDTSDKISFATTLRQKLIYWHRILPIEQKKVLRSAVGVLYVRGYSLIGLQPNFALLPMPSLEREGVCSSGSDGT